ncbi:cytochrome ubiquinol oxidase subunit I, partial [Staphylococcus epidermidis]|uniref:cytochrome ubiquinol oxidase subunit I n=1 Tax=Staphylococcus epidermidis TaxID=1282 RepID=UPI0037D9CE0D
MIPRSFSPFFITSLNSFINTPPPFQIKNPPILNLHPLQAIFNSSFILPPLHLLPTPPITIPFILPPIPPFKLLPHNHTQHTTYHTKPLNLTIILPFINTLLSIIPPHLSPKFLHKLQPHNLPPYQSHYHTQSHPNLVLFP